VGIVGGAFYGAYAITHAISTSVENARLGMRKKGVNWSTNGISVKTDKRALTQQEIIDAQRASMSEMAAKAANYIKVGAVSSSNPFETTPSMSRTATAPTVSPAGDSNPRRKGSSSKANRI